MSKIYDLTAEQEQLIDELFFLNEEDDDYEFEYARINRELARLRGSAESTLNFLSSIYLELNITTETQQEVYRKQRKRFERTEAHKDRVKELILELTKKFNIKKLRCDFCDIRTQLNPPKVLYLDGFNVDNLPDECIKVIPEKHEPIAAEIKRLYKAGEELEGVKIVQELGIRIS